MGDTIDEPDTMSHSEIIEIMEEALSGMDLPGCISLVDTDGLVVYSIGDCEDQWVLENMNAYLIMNFEQTLEALMTNIGEIMDYLLISTHFKTFLIDDLRGCPLFIIVQTTPEIMYKILPILKSFVKSVESALGIKE